LLSLWKEWNVVLCFRGRNKLQMFENVTSSNKDLCRPLGIIMGVKWGRLHWVECATTMGETRIAYRIFVEKILFEDWEGEEENFKIDLRELGWKGGCLIELAQGHVQWVAFLAGLNLHILLSSICYLTVTEI
jgi:hypothetical protein